mmetsp:Transcript_18898/g.35118  ORF Transcript_18898/g.35118 Transcript_18898/m.35118 type:complete len:94 (-) Transcript_18898:293-574(-)
MGRMLNWIGLHTCSFALSCVSSPAEALTRTEANIATQEEEEDVAVVAARVMAVQFTSSMEVCWMGSEERSETISRLLLIPPWLLPSPSLLPAL